MTQSRLSEIKRAQKSAQLYKTLSQLILQVQIDNPELGQLSFMRVDLSNDKSVCYLFFYTPGGFDKFKELLPNLVLFKPSLRKAVSQLIPGRYTPNLIFRFDDKFEKQQRLEKILSDVSNEISEFEEE